MLLSTSFAQQRGGGGAGATFGGGGTTFGGGGSPDAASERIGEIIDQGVSPEGTRFDRDSRPPNAFVGNDSQEEGFGFIGIVGRGGVNSASANSGANGFVGATSNRGGLGGAGGFGGNTGLGGRTGGLGAGGFGTTGLGTTGSRGGGLTGGLGQTGGLGGRTGGFGGQGGRTGGVGGLGTTGFGGQGGFGGQAGFGGQGRNAGVGAQGRTTNQINYQTRLSLRFRPRRVTTNALQANVSNRLNNSTRISKSGNIRVELTAKKAVLKGVVATDRDRQLAIALALLEPGISEVEDALEVSQPDADQPFEG